MEAQPSATKLAEKLDSAAKIHSFSLIFSKFRARLSEVVSEAAALKKINSEQEKIISDLRAELGTSTPKRDPAVDPEVGERMARYALLVQENETLRQEVTQLKCHLAAKATAHEECTNALYEATVSLKEKTRVTELLTSRVTNFEAQMETFEKRAEALRTDVREITKQYVQYKEYVAITVKTLRGATDKIQRLSEQLESKHKVVQERDGTIKQLQSLVREKDFAIEQQNRQLRDVSSDVALAKSSASAAQKRVDDMIVEKQKILASFTTLDGSLADARAVIAKQQAALIALTDECAELKLRLEKTTSTVDPPRVRELELISSMRVEQERKMKELLAMQQIQHSANLSSLSTVQENLRSLQKEYAEVTQREEALKIDCAVLRAKLEPLEERMPTLLYDLSKAGEKVDLAEKQLASLRAELESAKQQAAPSADASSAHETTPLVVKTEVPAAPVIAVPTEDVVLPEQSQSQEEVTPVPLPPTVTSPTPSRATKPISSSSSLVAAASYAAVAAPSAPAVSSRVGKRLASTQIPSRDEEVVEEELDDLSSLNCCASCNAPSYGLMVSCIRCKKQFHASCVAIASVDSKFTCSHCKLTAKAANSSSSSSHHHRSGSSSSSSNANKKGKGSAKGGAAVADVMQIASFV